MVLKMEKNINNCHYDIDTTMVAENANDPETLVMKIKGGNKNGTNIIKEKED